MNVKFITTVQ